MRVLSLSLVVLLTGTTFADPWKLDDRVKIAKPSDLIDVASTPAPEGAIVLFDGKSLDQWTGKDGKSKAKWALRDGVMAVPGVTDGLTKRGDIITKEKFDGSFLLHVEFRVPYVPEGKGQGRGNSGVYLQGRYEIQVLDSYGLKSGKNDCAAIYDYVPPTVNACKAPTVWQSYDIEFTAPKFVAGKKSEPARVTVRHNGIPVHDRKEIPTDNTRSGAGGDPSTPGPILLQDHSHPVQYRNIWLLKK